MPEDSFGNYITGLDSAAVAAVVANAPFVHGTGAPGATTPDWARGYIDDATGNEYVKLANGTWQLTP